MLHEAIDYNDPLAILMAQEDDIDEGLESAYSAGMHRTATCERERLDVDMLGASPAELAWESFNISEA